MQALIQAYSAQLASELGERTVAEVVNRLQSKLYEGASSAVGSYTGKEKCTHTRLSWAHIGSPCARVSMTPTATCAMLKACPNCVNVCLADELGDITKKAVADLTGKDVGQCKPNCSNAPSLPRHRGGECC